MPDPRQTAALITGVARSLDLPPSSLDQALGALGAPGLDAQIDRLTAAIGVRGGVAWPTGLEPSPAADAFHLLAVLATVPATRRWYAEHGVCAQVAHDTLDDLRQKLRDYSVAETGVDWFVQVVTANVFTLGRLQFEPGAEAPDTGEPAWSVHIPETGPLDPAACDASFAAAAPFFAAVLGDTATRAFVCHSWLLDDQLAEYLPHDGNILAFQRRFRLVDTESTDAPADGATEGDRAVAKFIFRAPLSRLPGTVPTSSLERAVLEHLAAGRHWRERSGVLRA